MKIRLKKQNTEFIGVFFLISADFLKKLGFWNGEIADINRNVKDWTVITSSGIIHLIRTQNFLKS